MKAEIHPDAPYALITGQIFITFLVILSVYFKVALWVNLEEA
jgi:hypothetical protein